MDCPNVGLLLLTCPQAVWLENAQTVELDLDTLAVILPTRGRLPCEPVPGFLLDRVRAGGLLDQRKQRLRGPATHP